MTIGTFLPGRERASNHLESKYQDSKDALQQRLDIVLSEIAQYGSLYRDEVVRDTRSREIFQLINKLIGWFAALTLASMFAFWLDSNSLGFGFLWMNLTVIQVFAYTYWIKTNAHRLFDPFVLPYTSMITLVTSIFCFALAIYQIFAT